MRILSVDGGGYLGLASATFLAELERHFGVHCRERFDLFCGTSTGAIIALSLAAGKTAAEVVSLYEELGHRVFPPRNGVHRFYRRVIRGARYAQHSNGPLREALQGAFGDLSLGDLRARGKLALVAAFCVSGGEPRVFKTDHSQNLSAHDGYLLRDIALASAAAPTLLPIVELRNPQTGVSERFCDGGVFANTPALLGYAEAAYELQVPPSQIELLSVSSPRVDHGEYASIRDKGASRLDRGWWRWKNTLADVMVDATSMISSRALARIISAYGSGSAQYERIDLRRPAGLDIDVATAAATETLSNIGNAEASRTDVRTRIRPFFRDQSQGGTPDGKAAEVFRAVP